MATDGREGLPPLPPQLANTQEASAERGIRPDLWRSESSQQELLHCMDSPCKSWEGPTVWSCWGSEGLLSPQFAFQRRKAIEVLLWNWTQTTIVSYSHPTHRKTRKLAWNYLRARSSGGKEKTMDLLLHPHLRLPRELHLPEGWPAGGTHIQSGLHKM